jgi:hypothetical protein
LTGSSISANTAPFIYKLSLATTSFHIVPVGHLNKPSNHLSLGNMISAVNTASLHSEREDYKTEEHSKTLFIT